MTEFSGYAESRNTRTRRCGSLMQIDMAAPITPHIPENSVSRISPVSRMLKKSEALEKPMSTRLKMTENYPVKLLFGLILTRFVDSGI